MTVDCPATDINKIGDEIGGGGIVGVEEVDEADEEEDEGDKMDEVAEFVSWGAFIGGRLSTFEGAKLEAWSEAAVEVVNVVFVPSSVFFFVASDKRLSLDEQDWKADSVADKKISSALEAELAQEEEEVGL